MLTAKNKAEELMQKALVHLENQMIKVRTGRANASIFENVKVEYYGTLTPLAQTGSITVPEPRTIVVKPYDKSIVKDIAAAIRNSGLGLNPNAEGDLVRVIIPSMTQEIRKRMVKDLGIYEEEAKVLVRKGRQEANNIIKKNEELSKDGKKAAQEDIQEITNKYIAKVEAMVAAKAEDVMRV